MAKGSPQQDGSLTQTEAIRRVIRELGGDTEVPQILDYIWKHFGIGARDGRGLEFSPPADSKPATPTASRGSGTTATPVAAPEAPRRLRKKADPPSRGDGRTGGRGKRKGRRQSR